MRCHLFPKLFELGNNYSATEGPADLLLPNDSGITRRSSEGPKKSLQPQRTHMLGGKQTLAMCLLTRISDCTPYKPPGEHGDWAPREQILDANREKLWVTCMAWEFSPQNC